MFSKSTPKAPIMMMLLTTVVTLLCRPTFGIPILSVTLNLTNCSQKKEGTNDAQMKTKSLKSGHTVCVAL